MILTELDRSEYKSILRYLLRLSNDHGFMVGISGRTMHECSQVISDISNLTEFKTKSCKTRNKLSLDFNSGGGIFTSIAGINSFRGRSLKVLYLHNHSSYREDKMKELLNSALPSLSSLNGELIKCN